MVLVRRTFTDKAIGFRLMSTGTNGQWVDDNYLGGRCFDAAAREVNALDAQKVAARRDAAV